MSSFQDEVVCPQCKSRAVRETYSTGEEYTCCVHCGRRTQTQYYCDASDLVSKGYGTYRCTYKAGHAVIGMFKRAKRWKHRIASLQRQLKRSKVTAFSVTRKERGKWVETHLKHPALKFRIKHKKVRPVPEKWLTEPLPADYPF